MNRDETRAILNVLYVAYPNSYNGWTESKFETCTDLWTETFKDFPYSIVNKAVTKIIKTSRSPYAPVIGEIMATITRMVTVYDAGEQWDRVKYIVRNVEEGRHRAIREQLDDIAQSLVTESDIRHWQENSGSMDYDRADFVKRYEKIKAEKEGDALLTGNLGAISDKARIEALGLRRDMLPDWYNADPDRQSSGEKVTEEDIEEFQKTLSQMNGS